MASSLRRGIIPQLRKLTLLYSPDAGSSRGMRAFIEKSAVALADSNPKVVFEAKPIQRWRHPYLKAEYLCGKERTVGVKNLGSSDVAWHANILIEASGAKPKKVQPPVITSKPSHQGNWHPLRSDGSHLSAARKGR